MLTFFSQGKVGKKSLQALKECTSDDDFVSLPSQTRQKPKSDTNHDNLVKSNTDPTESKQTKPKGMSKKPKSPSKKRSVTEQQLRSPFKENDTVDSSDGVKSSKKYKGEKNISLDKRSDHQNNQVQLGNDSGQSSSRIVKSSRKRNKTKRNSTENVPFGQDDEQKINLPREETVHDVPDEAKSDSEYSSVRKTKSPKKRKCEIREHTSSEGNRNDCEEVTGPQDLMESSLPTPEIKSRKYHFNSVITANSSCSVDDVELKSTNGSSDLQMMSSVKSCSHEGSSQMDGRISSPPHSISESNGNNKSKQIIEIEDSSFDGESCEGNVSKPDSKLSDEVGDVKVPMKLRAQKRKRLSFDDVKEPPSKRRKQIKEVGKPRSPKKSPMDVVKTEWDGPLLPSFPHLSPSQSRFGVTGPPPHAGLKKLPEGTSTCLAQHVFLITGVLDSLEREEAQRFIEKHGGSVSKTMALKTTHVLIGNDYGAVKVAKAKERNLKFWDEDQLLEFVRSSKVQEPQKPQVTHHSIGNTEIPNIDVSSSGTDQLWVEKYRPTKSSELVGNVVQIKTLQQWLSNW
eukprot:TRINITY_DN15164_c0_g1_i6.p1 TRINITY_DN15164_c0_g1~~TRINITY_DN15164_c0_g1_i6.p1  ORF type:complete len:568 (-),score=106.79 TRINITY_DN15164_c0_g1_i6:1842-3545(-)